MTRLLDTINSPADLQKIPQNELTTLAQEIRRELIDTTRTTGGHLASSLGAVELTIAMHRVFNCPIDKIIWDVGHQSYAHKLITGRRSVFHTLRQYGGLSGFPVREESPYDAFGAGHASTSISAALGIAAARDLTGGDFHVIAVIGDGAVTGGMALEALNNAAPLGARLIVILNDNGMSISPTVGSVAHLLRRVRFSRRYYRATESGKKIATSSVLGRRFWRLAKIIKTSLKSLIMPTLFWEELGFAYMGPIDGHNIPELESALRQARDYEHKPILVHVVTTKGKGYGPAEDDAVCFHGVSPKIGAIKVAPSYSQIFSETVQQLMRADDKVVVITAAMPDGTGLAAVQKEFPRRVFDVGICEQHAVTFAAGLASQGLHPIVAIYSTFLQRAFDQIIHDVALQRLPVAFALDRAGIVGDDGKTHQGIFDLSYLALIPNLAVAAPKDENELRHLLNTAVYAGSTMAVRYPRGTGLGTVLDKNLRTLPIGRGEILRTGKDIAILALGVTVAPALQAAETLAAQGIQPTVINARFMKPLDAELIIRVARATGRLVTVEENVLIGGFGNAVSALLQAEGLMDVRLKALGIPDEFVTHGPQDVLRACFQLDAPGIARAVITAFPELALQLAQESTPPLIQNQL
jgi:1-deoxy-D-xylulose-5-phosphate synthase